MYILKFLLSLVFNTNRYWQYISQYNTFRTFLVVQWLRIHLPMQGHRFDPWSGKIPHAVGQLKPVPTPEAQVTSSQRSATREATATRSHVPQLEHPGPSTARDRPQQ